MFITFHDVTINGKVLIAPEAVEWIAERDSRTTTIGLAGNVFVVGEPLASVVEKFEEYLKRDDFPEIDYFN